jgi:predicted Fe-Mo cluster-binding NifX family protein
LVIYDSETGEVESINNSQNFNAAQGAGIKAAELVADRGCAVVLTGHLGPKAFDVLKKAGIKGYNNAAGKVKEAVAAFQNGKLQEVMEADVEGHW